MTVHQNSSSLHFFYVPDLSVSPLTLSEEESRHCTKVLRLKEGDKVCLIDGKGSLAEAILSSIHPPSCQVEVLHVRKEPPLPYYLHIAIVPTKSMSRFEFFLEKSVELGIHRITPLISRYSEREYLRSSRCLKVFISAMKQSRQVHLPQWDEITPFSTFIQGKHEGSRWIAHMEANRVALLHPKIATKKNVVLIGPEGGFSQEEVHKARKAGFQLLSLGASRLRTETAAIYIAAYFREHYGKGLGVPK